MLEQRLEQKLVVEDYLKEIVLNLLQSHQKLQAVKLIRDHYRVGLAVAVNAVDEISGFAYVPCPHCNGYGRVKVSKKDGFTP